MGTAPLPSAERIPLAEAHGKRGILQVNTNNALGTAANGTTVSNGATLRLNNVNYSTAEPLTINGNWLQQRGALANSGTSTFAGPINAVTMPRSMPAVAF